MRTQAHARAGRAWAHVTGTLVIGAVVVVVIAPGAGALLRRLRVFH